MRRAPLSPGLYRSIISHIAPKGQKQNQGESRQARSLIGELLLHSHQLILGGANAQGLGGLDGVGAVAAVDALHKVVTARVGAVLDQVQAGAVQRDGVQADRMPMSPMQGFSATAQQSQSTDRFFITAT